MQCLRLLALSEQATLAVRGFERHIQEITLMKKWVPIDGGWWRKAMRKAGIYQKLESELNELTARLRMDRAIAKSEVNKCRALMAVRKIIR